MSDVLGYLCYFPRADLEIFCQICRALSIKSGNLLENCQAPSGKVRKSAGKLSDLLKKLRKSVGKLSGTLKKNQEICWKIVRLTQESQEICGKTVRHTQETQEICWNMSGRNWMRAMDFITTVKTADLTSDWQLTSIALMARMYVDTVHPQESKTDNPFLSTFLFFYKLFFLLQAYLLVPVCIPRQSTRTQHDWSYRDSA